MLFYLFRRVIKDHLGFHLFIPVLLIVLVSAWPDAGLRTYKPGPWLTFFQQLPTRKLGELIEVYVSFVLVVAWSVKRAGDVQSTRVDTLRDVLPGATRYFAIGVIPLWEWFDVSTILYLCTVIEHQMSAPPFRHERVLLFKRRRDLDALSVSYLDEPFAKAFASIHSKFNIPLSYLEPVDVKRVLHDLSADDKAALGWTRPWVVRLRTHCRWIPEEWTIGSLSPFALIERQNGESALLRFEKHGNTLMLPIAVDPAEIDAARRVVDALVKIVYVPGTTQLKHQFTFDDFLRP